MSYVLEATAKTSARMRNKFLYTLRKRSIQLKIILSFTCALAMSLRLSVCLSVGALIETLMTRI